jgi:hypothetical protein
MAAGLAAYVRAAGRAVVARDCPAIGHLYGLARISLRHCTPPVCADAWVGSLHPTHASCAKQCTCGGAPCVAMELRAGLGRWPVDGTRAGG